MTQADELQQRADAFADRSIQFVEGLPPPLIAQRIGGQYLDASTSVAANYRAARRGRSYAEFAAKIGIVAEEADESVFWLRRLANARINSSVAAEPLLAEPSNWQRSSAPPRAPRASAAAANDPIPNTQMRANGSIQLVQIHAQITD